MYFFIYTGAQTPIQLLVSLDNDTHNKIKQQKDVVIITTNNNYYTYFMKFILNVSYNVKF